MKLTRENFAVAKEFAGGSMVGSYMTHNDGPEINLAPLYPPSDRMTAKEGEWLVKDKDGKVDVYPQEEFEAEFEI